MILSLLLAASPALASGWSEAMATGDCTTVLAALPSPATDPQRLAVARCAARLGDPARAADVAAQVTGELRPYGAVTRAEALLALGRPGDASAALAGLTLAGPSDELVRGRALLAAGRAADAANTLSTLTTGSVGDEASWWLGQAREATDKASAIATYTKLWTDFPSSARADDAATRLAALGSPVPDFTTEAGRATAMTRAKKLLKLSLADRAVPLLDGIHAAAPFATPGAQRFMADSLFSAKQYARAVEWYGKCGAATADARGAFQEALATARSGDYPGAATKYAALVKRFPTSTEADEASFKPAYMDYDAGRYAEAIRGFDTYLAARPTGKFASDSRWLRAWSHHKLGETSAALAGFDEVIAKDGATDLAAGARYWKARTNGDTAGLKTVIEKHPETGYAWFAAERLDVHTPAPAPAATPTFPAEWLATHPKVATAIQLLDAGLPEYARGWLTSAEVEAAKANETTRLAMAATLVRAERYRDAQALASGLCSKSAAKAACLPRPYPETIGAMTAASGLDPLLPYAIMNAESALDPSVTSPAGARGLMQLMPALAPALAQGQVPGFEVDDLYRAGINARLGTTELVGLLQRLGGLGVTPSLPLVIAGYNGGPEAVERWVKGYPTTPDADRFAEDISFTETRRYVRRVLGYLMKYRRAYGG